MEKKMLNRCIYVRVLADNLMLRGGNTQRLVMIDFGVSAETGFVAANVEPLGSQTHWSPEKAAGHGYDSGADVWAAVAVFVHMLAGHEPWASRYPHHRYIHYIVSWPLLFLLGCIAINAVRRKKEALFFYTHSFIPRQSVTAKKEYKKQNLTKQNKNKYNSSLSLQFVLFILTAHYTVDYYKHEI